MNQEINKLNWEYRGHINGCSRYVQANDRVMLYAAAIPADMTLAEAAAAYCQTADYSDGLEQAIDFTLVVDGEPTEEISVSPKEFEAASK
jgi:hypothetical protein